MISSKFILGKKAEGEKAKEMIYSLLNLNEISFFYTQPQLWTQVWNWIIRSGSFCLSLKASELEAAASFLKK